MSTVSTLLAEAGLALLLGYILKKIRLPGGLLIGAIVGAAILRIFFSVGYAPSGFKFVAQIIMGAYLGCSMSRDDVRKIPMVLKPALISVCSFFLLCLLCSYFFRKLGKTDLLTSLFCSMPGGISDTPLIAMDMGASVTPVVAAHLVRSIYGMGVLPTLILFADKIAAPKLSAAISDAGADCIAAPTPDAAIVDAEAETAPDKAGARPEKPLKSILLTIAVAAAGGAVGKLLELPAGTLTFALLAVLFYHLKTEKAYLPAGMRRGAQLLSGIYIGNKFALEEVLMIQKLILPICLLLAGYTVVCIACGIFFAKHFDMGLREAMLSMSPAGATEITLIAADMGVVSPRLLVMQLFRLLTALIVFPQLFSLILMLCGQ